MTPQYPNFKKLQLDDLESIRNLLHKYQVDICELNLANLFIWKDFDRVQLTFINNNLCILIDSFVEPCFFLEPIGHHKIEETVDLCLSYCNRLSRLSEKSVTGLPKNKYHFKCLRSQFDYVYLRQRLAEFKGKKFDGKRNHIKRFKRHFPNYEYVVLKQKYKHEAIELFEKWFSIRQQSRHFPRLSYQAQKSALQTAFNHFKELRLSGGAIFAQGKMQGFILGSPTSPEMINLHFLYGNPKIQGISQILLQESCQRTFKDYKYVNQEQDLGIPGLRKAKLSYQPLRLEKKFEIRLK